ncbi:MAG: HU family DNA-binding protein, partial [Elusimicrobiota bacterium]|nr:HU family DNA-binding protein [Elusimicrobiota bacterium]
RTDKKTSSGRHSKSHRCHGRFYPGRGMNETEIVATIAHYLFLTKAEVKETVDYMADEFAEKLKNGERIKIRNFGSLARVKRKKRRLRDINTGKMITVPEHYTIEFRPSPFLKEKINDQDAV